MNKKQKNILIKIPNCQNNDWENQLQIIIWIKKTNFRHNKYAMEIKMKKLAYYRHEQEINKLIMDK